MNIKPELLTLYGITDRSWLKGEPLAKVVEQVLKGGVTLLQLREKNMPLKEFIKEAKEIRRVTDFYGVPLIINDSIEVCLACEAAGVHVGQSDMEAGEVRRLLGEDKIIGVTAKTVEQAVMAQKCGASYLGSGAVFGSETKPDAKKLSLEMLDTICDCVDIPVVAIGGIHEGNMDLLKGHKMNGSAVVSALFGAKEPQEAARRMRAAMARICDCNTDGR